MEYTLVHCSGARKGLWFSRDDAENFRLMLDDYWLWTVVNINEL